MKCSTFLCLLPLLLVTVSSTESDKWQWDSSAVNPAVPAEVPEGAARALPVEEPWEKFNLFSDNSGQAIFPEEEEEEVLVPVIDEKYQDELQQIPVEDEDSLVQLLGNDSVSALKKGVREGRFLGISDALCSIGLGFGCDQKDGGPVASEKFSSYSSYPGAKPPGKSKYAMKKPFPPHMVPGRGPSIVPDSSNKLSSVQRPIPAPSQVSFQAVPMPGKPQLPAPRPFIQPPPQGSFQAQPSIQQALLVHKQSSSIGGGFSGPTFDTPKKSFVVDSQASFQSHQPNVIRAPQKISATPTIVHHVHTHIYDGVAPPTDHDDFDLYISDSEIKPFSLAHNIQQANLAFGTPSKPIQQVNSQFSGPPQQSQQNSVFSQKTQQASPTFSTNQFNRPTQQSFSQNIESGRPNSFTPGKLEMGFKPAVLDPLFQRQVSAYEEDCHCVPAMHCPASNVVRRTSNDISNLIDARNKPMNIFSNSTDAEETFAEENNAEPDEESTTAATSTTTSHSTSTTAKSTTTTPSSTGTVKITSRFRQYVRPNRTLNSQIAARRGKVMALPEAPLEAPLEEGLATSRQVRSAGDEEPEDVESADTIAYTDRQGRQLNGYTPNRSGCGADHVCCRRPVYSPRRQLSTCGRRNAAGLLGRVKTQVEENGNAEFGEYPWQAAILRMEKGDSIYVCGAALIDARHVLTAAHCVNDVNVSELKVRVGEWDVGRDNEFYNHVEDTVIRVTLHPKFYSGNLENDLAVLQLARELDFSANPHVAPVCLGDSYVDFTNQRCFTTGWGKDAFGKDGKFQHVLKEVEVPVVSRQQCTSIMQQTRLGAEFKLSDGMICAGGEEGKDACKGDGGGPLVCAAPDGSFQLAGLVSWGIGCGHRGVPGVYVDVPFYLHWIRSVTKQ